MTARDLREFVERGQRMQAGIDAQLSLLPEKSVARARSSDPDTSHEAAASIDGITKRQDAIVRIFKSFGPMCDEKLLRIYDRFMRDQPHLFPLQSPSGIRSRRAELADPEKFQPPRIVFSGRKEKNANGRSTRVWTLARESWKTT
ncbi:MAG: hypothetical protein M3P26_04495 [Gemmatimonadota bacterium]|nr:hypothetical protein [Gemmatimonadota bacterium]